MIASAADYAPGDGRTDATAGLRNAIAANSALFLPPDKRFLISSPLVIQKPFTLVGANPGVGPGLMTDQGCSQIICASGFNAGDAIMYTSLYGGVFRDFQIIAADGLGQTSVSRRGAGAGLHIIGPAGATNMRSIVENVAFSGFDTNLQCTRCADQVVDDCYFQAWRTAGYYVDNGATDIESSLGHVKSKFFGDATPGTTQQFGILTRHGYGTVKSTIVGSQIGIGLMVTEHSVGSLFVNGSSLEEQSQDSIRIVQAPPYRIGSIQINGNEFSSLDIKSLSHVTIVGTSADSILTIDVSHNGIYSFMQGGASACFNIQCGSLVTAVYNRAIIDSAYLIIVGANVVNHCVTPNLIAGNPTGNGYYP